MSQKAEILSVYSSTALACQLIEPLEVAVQCWGRESLSIVVSATCDIGSRNQQDIKSFCIVFTCLFVYLRQGYISLAGTYCVGLGWT